MSVEVIRERIKAGGSHDTLGRLEHLRWAGILSVLVETNDGQSSLSLFPLDASWNLPSTPSGSAFTQASTDKLPEQPKQTEMEVPEAARGDKELMELMRASSIRNFTQLQQ